ncbi:LysR substrate-binding domain-containing protein [Telmatospirillum siberiense]|uniref:LysR family transcriptional regulator n=1 Tax=Telmatospirillum siberiense TaxID=382514 RepID=A0A2N3PS32_9PROT|nr:LysR substrate-binding domain-containing protein [Telmatospirillum siberiense]PKU23184.1 LysR family transcriptional regulator [Telmatospirillum siberiense]
MFEFSHLRCFIVLAEELHFHRAAQRLNMTQPPLSRQIQLLEHELGVCLLRRSSRLVELTPAGKAFYLEARRLLHIAENAKVIAQRMARGESGLVTLGFTAASSYAFLPRLVALAKEKLPEIDLVLREMVTLDQIEALNSGRIDLGFLRPPLNRYGISGKRILREPLLLAVPRDHPLAACEQLRLTDLDRQPFITYSPVEGRYFHDLLAGLFQTAGVAPNYVQYAIQTHSILALVNAGIGLAVVPESARNLHPDGVVLRDFPSEAKASTELFLAWRDGNENPAASVLSELILREFGGGGSSAK